MEAYERALPKAYRTYDQEAVARLGFIRAAQSVGLSLGEIREIMVFGDRGETRCAHVLALIEQRVADLGDRIAALERMRGDLQRLSRRGRRVGPTARQAVFCHIIEGPHMRSRRSGANGRPRSKTTTKDAGIAGARGTS